MYIDLMQLLVIVKIVFYGMLAGMLWHLIGLIKQTTIFLRKANHIATNLEPISDGVSEVSVGVFNGLRGLFNIIVEKLNKNLENEKEHQATNAL